MPFTVPQLLRHRPYMYHLTAAQNVEAILRTMQLRSASSLLAESGCIDQLSVKRVQHMSLTKGVETVWIRDQKPLIEGAIAFEHGWDLKRFVEHVNEHVFFWPGTDEGPIKAGLNHFERYRSEAPIVLRIATQHALAATLKFSRFNSGAPRCSGGKYSPRGSQTYLSADTFFGTISDVVEVVVRNAVALPRSVEIASSPHGPWCPVREAVYPA